MARIVILTHEFDNFAHRSFFWQPWKSGYLLFGVLEALRRSGHSWRIMRGLDERIPGDVCILHVDCTVIPDVYLALADEFPLTLNFGVKDISKRVVSGALLSKDDPWQGPVIVKSNLNSGGWPEEVHNRAAERRGSNFPHARYRPYSNYNILPSRDEVPQAIWTDPDLVVEKFVAEKDEEGYAIRTWVFMGSRERCTRHVARNPIVRADDIVSRTPSEIPDELRAERARLGFDYGKLDFVWHEGRPILLDANRTPGAPANLRSFLRAGAQNLAEGLEEMMS